MSNNHNISDQSHLAHRRAVDLAAKAFYGADWRRQFKVIHHPGQGTYSVSSASEDCENGMRRIVAQYPKGRSRNIGSR